MGTVSRTGLTQDLWNSLELENNGFEFFPQFFDQLFPLEKKTRPYFFRRAGADLRRGDVICFVSPLVCVLREPWGSRPGEKVSLPCPSVRPSGRFLEAL
jgi:hypothetical protein